MIQNVLYNQAINYGSPLTIKNGETISLHVDVTDILKEGICVNHWSETMPSINEKTRTRHLLNNNQSETDQICGGVFSLLKIRVSLLQGVHVIDRPLRAVIEKWLRRAVYLSKALQSLIWIIDVHYSMDEMSWGVGEISRSGIMSVLELRRFSRDGIRWDRISIPTVLLWLKIDKNCRLDKHVTSDVRLITTIYDVFN